MKGLGAIGWGLVGAMVLCGKSAVAIPFTPPLDDTPREQAGQGLARCCQPTALLPRHGEGTTSQDRPTLYFSHFATEEYTQAMLLLTTPDGSQYEEIFDLPQVSGIVPVPIPANMPALIVGEWHTWTIILMDRGELTPASPVISGDILRVESPLGQAELSEMTPDDRLLLYGEAGIWYDFISTLAQMRLVEPNDAQLVHLWSKTLRQMGLQHVVEQPIAS